MDNNSRLFVGNLSYQTQERDLQDHFSASGVVTNVNLMLDRVTGKSRGFAFVEFATADEANRAVEMFHGKDLGGRALTVNIARPREERAPGGGGGGGFRGGGGGGGGGGYRGVYVHGRYMCGVYVPGSAPGCVQEEEEEGQRWVYAHMGRVGV